ncbi:hypothetical protein GCM10008967_28650 [Bacillus carboniphilus]|uniref:Uncharacterized protein n=1 Tax=Bacillus carboniphilus TaxID=86663 RepID=A0ABP3G5F8_9BACI
MDHNYKDDLDSQLKEMNKSNRSHKDKMMTFEKLKNSSPRKFSPQKYYAAISLLVVLLFILVIPNMNSLIKEWQKTSEPPLVEKIVEENLVGTNVFTVDDITQDKLTKVSKYFKSEQKPSNITISPNYKPTLYSIRYDNASVENYYVWIDGRRTDEGIVFEGAFQREGDDNLYEISQEIATILLSDFFTYDMELEESHLLSLEQFNELDVSTNNSLLQKTNFKEITLNQVNIPNVDVPLDISAQTLMKNYMGLPNWKLESQGSYILMYEECLCGFNVGFQYDKKPYIEVAGYFVPLEDISGDEIKAALGEPIFFEESQTVSSYTLGYFNENHNGALMFRSYSNDKDTFHSFSVWRNK